MDSSLPINTFLQESTSLTQCVCEICGINHNLTNCDFIQISKYVPDKVVPTKAKLTLPDFLEVERLSDGFYSTVAKTLINKGTQFGPFLAERSSNLDPEVVFPLKVFAQNGTYEFLENNNEEKCNWLYFIGVADNSIEQNLVCYQQKNEIYYLTMKEVNVGDVLKVWYCPYYATKMNATLLQDKQNVEELNVDINLLIKKQQKIMERKVWTCKFCSKTENNIVEFAKHILFHYSSKQRNLCEICKKTFSTKLRLKNHIKIVHSLPVIKSKKIVEDGIAEPCKDVVIGGPLLNDLFTDSSDLHQSDLNQFDLSMENQFLDNDNLTVDHLLNDNVKDLDHFNFEIADNQKQFVCDICLKQFTKVKFLIVHLRRHTGDFWCNKCLKVFSRKENLKNHSCNCTLEYECTICDKKFPQKKYLSRHLQVRHYNKFYCALCNKCYYSNKELSDHNCVKIPNSQKEKFMCPICDKCFYRDLYLKKHLEKHGPRSDTKKIKKMSCEICGMVFVHRNSFYLHRKKHQDPSYLCEICDKKFHRYDSLKRHLLTHQTTQFECKVCGKKFKTNQYLSQHMKCHNADKRSYVTCHKCNINFKNSTFLKRHIKNHGEKISNVVSFEFYACPVCDKRVKLKSSLLRHFKKIHKDVSFDPKSVVQKTTVLKENAVTKVDKAGIEEQEELKQSLNSEIDNQIHNLLESAENNLTIEKHAVDSLVEELDINIKTQKSSKEICLSIPDLTQPFEDITLSNNAYILDNGTIVQPQDNSDNVIIYVLDQGYS